jgi:small-conductance mechanosensitive channel
MNWNIEVVEPARTILERAVNFIPKLVGIIVILLVGWIIAKIIEKIVIRLLKLAQLDRASEKTGVARFLRKGEIKYTLSELIGILVYWLIILAVIMAAANMLNLEVAATLLNQFILFVPRVIASVFVLVLGIFFANLLGAVVRSTAINAGISEGRALGKITQVIVIIFAVVTALYQLEIAKGILASAFTVVVGAFGLAVALAFGLGCKDMAAKWISEWADKFKKKE